MTSSPGLAATASNDAPPIVNRRRASGPVGQGSIRFHPAGPSGQIRSPKSEIRKNPEIRNPKGEHRNPMRAPFLLSNRVSDFGFLSDFGIRISEFDHWPARSGNPHAQSVI